jgi:outer membrane protein
MRTTIATIAVTLTVLYASMANAEDSSRTAGVSGPVLEGMAPAWTIHFGQTAVPPARVAPAEPAPLTGAAQSTESAAGEPVLTLDEALTLALTDNRGVRTATLEVGRAGDRIGAAQARRLPALRVGLGADYTLTPIDLDFRRGDFGTYPGIGPVPANDTTLSTQKLLAAASAGVVQPLAQQYRLGLTVDQLRVAQDIARQDLRAQRQGVASDVKRAYYLVLQAQSAREAVQEAIRSLRELDRVVEEQVGERTALRADSLDVKTRLAQAEADAFSASNELTTRKEQLNHLLGRGLDTPFRVSSVPEASLFEADLGAAQAQALRERPELNRADLQVRLADYDLRIKKAEFIPDVDLVLRYLHPATSSRLPQNIALAGVELSWEPFDWGRKSKEAADREKAMEQAKTTAAEMRSRILIDVNTRLRKLEETKMRLGVTTLGLTAARERLQVTTTRFGEGTALLADVLQSQAAVASAHDQYQSALLTFWTARADFDRALGETR